MSYSYLFTEFLGISTIMRTEAGQSDPGSMPARFINFTISGSRLVECYGLVISCCESCFEERIQNEKTHHRAGVRCVGVWTEQSRSEKEAAMKADLAGQLDGMKKQAQVMVDTVFSYGELGFQEFETSKYLSGILEKEGF